MDISVTGRHLTVTPAIEDYARKRIENIHIDFPRILDAHFIVEVDKFRQRAEVVVHCGNHIHIEASDVHEDLYAALDGVVDKVERQLRKYKTRIQDHRPRNAQPRQFEEQIFTHNLHEEAGLHRKIQEGAVNRPGLALAGFYKYFAFRRVQVMGGAEWQYLKSQSTIEAHRRVSDLLKQKIPCLAYARNVNPPKYVVELCDELEVPLF